MQIQTIDLLFQGEARAIAAYLVRGPEGPFLLEPGPSSTLPTLVNGLRELGVDPEEIQDVLVTHIHLDHAGSAGWWAERGARIHVHPVGAPHLADPSKLLASATRIYGDRMETLWGDVPPVPRDRLREVRDGERVRVGGLELEALDTPGHAWHHLVYRLEDVAFSGDAAGIRLPDNRWVDLPAPPPEFDREAWRATLERLAGKNLTTLYRTHFGPSGDVREELERLGDLIERSVEWVEGLRREGLSRDDQVQAFTRKMRARAASEGIRAEDTRAYELANPREMSLDGIGRYLQKRERSQ